MSDIKNIPSEPEVREAIRESAARAAGEMARVNPPLWEDLQSRGRAMLGPLGLGEEYLGYAMVCLNNAFWSEPFAAVPAHRRLLLLPHCLRDQAVCPAAMDAAGLHCAACGACLLAGLKQRAERLGYQVIVAEGTPSVLLKLLEDGADAVLGVACLDSLEKSYSRVADLGIPHMAVPLLSNGCVRTQADPEQIVKLLELAGPDRGRQTRSYLPLLRTTAGLFEPATLTGLLEPYLERPSAEDIPETLAATEREALGCLTGGGKRLRPFITMAAYAVATRGIKAIEPDVDPTDFIPVPVRRLAIAIEAMHKASLVHDDIEDGDESRDGRPTLHRRCGLGPAINIGDFLIGLGYRLVAGQAEMLGAAGAADILGRLAAAHLKLCRGQGGELLWRAPRLKPLDALYIYSLKTAPAFEVALHAGLLAAGKKVDVDRLSSFCVWLGEGFQVQDDLDDWRSDGADRLGPRQEVLAVRPTVLRAFALEAGGEAALADIERVATDSADPATATARLGEFYEALGVFAKAEALVDLLRERAIQIARSMESEDLRGLLEFLVRIVLPRRLAGSKRHGNGQRHVS